MELTLTNSHPGIPGYDAEYDVEVRMSGDTQVLRASEYALSCNYSEVIIDNNHITVPASLKDNYDLSDLKITAELKNDATKLGSCKLPVIRWNMTFNDDFDGTQSTENSERYVVDFSEYTVVNATGATASGNARTEAGIFSIKESNDAQIGKYLNFEKGSSGGNAAYYMFMLNSKGSYTSAQKADIIQLNAGEKYKFSVKYRVTGFEEAQNYQFRIYNTTANRYTPGNRNDATSTIVFSGKGSKTDWTVAEKVITAPAGADGDYSLIGAFVPTKTLTYPDGSQISDGDTDWSLDIDYIKIEKIDNSVDHTLWTSHDKIWHTEYDLKNGTTNIKVDDYCYVDNGNLVMPIIKNTSGKTWYMNGKDGSQTEFTPDYVSAEIRTDMTFNQEFGCFTVRMKGPAGSEVTAGSNNAFWLMPKGASWGDVCFFKYNEGDREGYACGEIDIVERSAAWGNGKWNNTLHSWSLETGEKYANEGYFVSYYNQELMVGDYIEYTTVWTQDALYTYANGKLLRKVSNITSLGNKAYMILSNNLNSMNPNDPAWTGYATDEDLEDLTVYVDYVRAYSAN